MLANSSLILAVFMHLTIYCSYLWDLCKELLRTRLFRDRKIWDHSLTSSEKSKEPITIGICCSKPFPLPAMANNNHLVMEIVLENGRSAVLEKQQEEIKQVRKQYWDVLMFLCKVLSDNGSRSPAAHVGPMYSAFVKDAALIASAEPTLLQARREELDHCKESIECLRRQIVRHVDDDDLQMWMDLMRMSVPTFPDESSH